MSRQIKVLRPATREWRITFGGNPPLERIVRWADLPDEVKVKYLLVAGDAENPHEVTLVITDGAAERLGMPKQTPYNFVKISLYARKTPYTSA